MIDGVVVIDKPAGCTSHDVVARCRKIFGQRKVGHSGTLDPDATGVLLVGLGGATRLLRFLTDLSKTYTAEVVLGTETSTLDASGEVVATYETGHVTLDALRRAAKGLTGDLMQTPPMVSAVKVDGVRLHELARQGRSVERVARPVTVHRFEVGDWVEAGVVSAEVECSSGTYVRVLAADLGTAVGSGAHLRNLRRTAIGSFSSASACPLDDVDTEAVLTPVEALADYPAVVVDAEMAARVVNGAKLAASVFDDAGEGPWRVVAPDGTLLAMYEPHRGGAKPAVVLPGRN